MWERLKDPNHPTGIPTRKVAPLDRPKGTEGNCWAVFAGSDAEATARGYQSGIPCTLKAHHLGRHSWQPAA